jgi:hypothetical protein
MNSSSSKAVPQTCPHCGKVWKVPVAYLDDSIPCQACGGTFVATERVIGEIVWAIVGIIGWVLPWAIWERDSRYMPDADIMWGYQIKLGLHDGNFYPGQMLPALLVVFIIVTGWAATQAQPGYLRSTSMILGLLAGITCLAQSVPVLILNYVGGAPFTPGIGAYILVVSGIALVAIKLRRLAQIANKKKRNPADTLDANA